MNPVVTEPGRVDAAWVEAALRRAGALAAGAVAAIDVEPVEGRAWSRMTRIGVRYAVGSIGECPPRLLLKLCSDAFGAAEVLYYTRDYVDLLEAPLPRCYDAAYEDRPRRYHLLLADLSDSHSNGDSCPPTAALACALASSLAALHAHRWGRERLRAVGLELPVRADFERWLAHVQPGLEPLLTASEGAIDPAWARRLRHLFARFVDRCTERAADPAGITQVHGDLNPGNLLVPRDGAGPILMVDRQPFDWSLTRWLGASDLVNAIVPWWDVEARRQLEPLVLRRYHAGLVARGIADYPFARLLDDYRLCIVEAIGIAVEWCVRGDDRSRMRWLWARELQRALAAYDDLHANVESSEPVESAKLQ